VAWVNLAVGWKAGVYREDAKGGKGDRRRGSLAESWSALSTKSHEGEQRCDRRPGGATATISGQSPMQFLASLREDVVQPSMGSFSPAVRAWRRGCFARRVVSALKALGSREGAKTQRTAGLRWCAPWFPVGQDGRRCGMD